MAGPADLEICPPNRRITSKRKPRWVELGYLCDKIMYHLHFRKQRYRVTRFIPRVREILRDIPKPWEAILCESGCSLQCEYDGKWKDGARHREKEITMIIRLHHSFTADQNEETRKWALQGYRKRYVLKRLALIRATYQAKATEGEVAVLDKLIANVKQSLDY